MKRERECARKREGEKGGQFTGLNTAQRSKKQTTQVPRSDRRQSVRNGILFASLSHECPWYEPGTTETLSCERKDSIRSRKCMHGKRNKNKTDVKYLLCAMRTIPITAVQNLKSNNASVSLSISSLLGARTDGEGEPREEWEWEGRTGEQTWKCDREGGRNWAVRGK